MTPDGDDRDKSKRIKQRSQAGGISASAYVVLPFPLFFKMQVSKRIKEGGQEGREGALRISIWLSGEATVGPTNQGKLAFLVRCNHGVETL
eukprot:scaffold22415_cov19-Tisochrysis_lutea.AAC.2